MNPHNTFYGTIFCREGMNPDPEKIEGITEMPLHSDVKQLQAFLWMLNFMLPYISKKKS